MPAMRTKTEEDPVAGGAVAANCWVGESDVIYFAAADAAAAAAVDDHLKIITYYTCNFQITTKIN